MKSVSISVLFFFLFLLNSICYSKPADLFEGIKLNSKLPQVFEAGESYYIKVTINNFKKRARTSVHLNYIDGDYQSSEQYLSTDGTFSFKLDLLYPGNYYLSMRVNYKSHGPIILTAINPIEIDTLQMLPISDFHLISNSNGIKLKWTSQNELIHLQLNQQEAGLNNELFLSNNPLEFRLDKYDFSGYRCGKATFRIRGARSCNGSKIAQSSDWTDWHIFETQFTEKLWSSKESFVEYTIPYNNIGKVDSTVNIHLNFRNYYDPIAYIKRPDGFVDHVPVESNKGRKEFTDGAEVVELQLPGDCVLSYTPNIAGTYIFEINDAFGNALLNIPYYCGNGVPLIPAKEIATEAEATDFDVEYARERMLNQVNRLRSVVQCHSLSLDTTLTQLSQYYSNRMSRGKFASHYAPDDENPRDRKVKFGIVTPLLENVASAESVEKALHNLVRSPIHYEAMIDTTVMHAGFGISRDENGLFYIAQHFAPEPLTQQEMDKFLAKIFTRMHSERKNLIRVYERSEWPSITSTIFKSPTLSSLENAIFSQKNQPGWKYKNVGEVYFESFEQTVDGLILKIKYYPHVKEEKKHKD